MIYLVTTNKDLSNNETYTIISVKESLKLLEPLEIVGLDTETDGLSCWSNKLKTVQLGCLDFQVVIDCLTVPILSYKSYLESNRLFVGQNLKFDLGFLYRNDIWPRNVYDLFLGEKLMWLGYPTVLSPDVWERIQCDRYTPKYANDGNISKYILEMNLKKLGELYLGVELDKSVRGRIIYEGLTDEVILYSANDVKYLESIMNLQKEKLQEKELLTAIKYENSFLLPLAYMEYCGIKLNVDKWKKKMEHDKEREEKALKSLNRWFISHFPNSKYIVRNLQGDIFNGFNTEPIVTLNWNSQQQLLPIFKSLGINVGTVQEGEEKDSLNAKVLAPQKDKSDLISIYLDYKEAVKVTSTYGQNFIDQINKVSGRIQTRYSQLGADTSRISSGGKESNGSQLINLLNLPADAETRACFEAEDGNCWISIDYTGQESYIMASMSNDRAMIDELTNGSKDLHSLTARLVFDEIPNDYPVKDIKRNYHELRQLAKGYEFCFNYSGDDSTLVKNYGISSERAKQIYDSYMSGFSGLAAYQKFRKHDWWDKGYILLNPKTGHKAFIYDYNALKQEYESFQEKGFWDYYRDLKKSSPDSYTVQKVKNFFKRKTSSSKQSVNYPIQGTGSMCLRVALIKFFNYLQNNNLLGVVKICVCPYDETDVEAPKEIAEEIAQVLYQCMVDAGAYFCTRCKLDADISHLPDGSLPTYWIH